MFKYNDILFRAIEETDLAFLYDMRCDEIINEQLFSVFPVSLFGQKAWLETMQKNEKNKILIVDFEGVNEKNTIGYIKLANIDFRNQNAEIGLDIQKNFRKKGLSKNVYNALFQYCFNYLNFHKVYLYVFESNIIAVNIYKKLGFEIEANLKKHVFRNSWKNILIMSKFR